MESNFPVFTQLLGRVLCMVNNYLCLTAICLQLEEPREKAMAPHSSTFAWKIPWTEEPGGLQSMGSLESDTSE